MEERRSLRRFNLQLPCLIRARGRDGETHYKLLSGNISSGGAYFGVPSPFDVGTQVTIHIIIRRSGPTVSRSGDSCIKVQGEVLRAGESGMAVEFDDQYHISRISPERDDCATLDYLSGGEDSLSRSFQESGPAELSPWEN
jgi:hypothetical protein